MSVVIDMTPKDSGLLNAILERDTNITSLSLDCDELGNSALRNMPSLETVHLNKATSIAAQAMQGCSALRHIYLHSDSIVTIANANAIPVLQIAATIKVHVPSNLIRSYPLENVWSQLYTDETIEFVAI